MFWHSDKPPVDVLELYSLKYCWKIRSWYWLVSVTSNAVYATYMSVLMLWFFGSPYIIGVRDKSRKGPFSSKELSLCHYFRCVFSFLSHPSCLSVCLAFASVGQSVSVRVYLFVCLSCVPCIFLCVCLSVCLSRRTEDLSKHWHCFVVNSPLLLLFCCQL